MRKGAVRPEPILTTNRHLLEFARRAAASIPRGARMLDAGAGDSPYRHLFGHAEYEAADICKRDAHRYAHVAHVCDRASIPVENDRYDLALCTQVLEHVADPVAVLRELRRVLKPGACLWISAPLSFEEHEVPYDFFRYTQFGWRHLMQTTGFEVMEIGWLQGYLGTLAYQLNLARHQLPFDPARYGPGLAGWAGAALAASSKPLLLVLAYLFSRLDYRYRSTSFGHPLDYCLVARRPAA
jgi:SAM-dependent methyltransferase